MSKLFSSLLINPVGSVNPRLDQSILFTVKMVYIIHRVSLRTVVGKKKREALLSDADNRLHYKHILSGRFSPSFYLARRFYTSRLAKKIYSKNPRLFKLNVSKYNYMIYCPPYKDDFIGLTVREEDIIDNCFTPKEGDTVIDVGAHVGRYSLIASKRVGSKGLVIAVEPDPINVQRLESNIELNHLTNVKIARCAICAEHKKIKLYLPSNDSQVTIYNTIMRERAHSSERSVDVDGYTLDHLADQYVDVDSITKDNLKEIWVKIDVEGAEYEVLKGATGLLSRNQDTSVLIEIHNLREGYNLYTPIIEFLKLYNFKLEFEKQYTGGEKHILLKKYRTV
jgi:FkbM family methyltransferase